MFLVLIEVLLLFSFVSAQFVSNEPASLAGNRLTSEQARDLARTWTRKNIREAASFFLELADNRRLDRSDSGGRYFRDAAEFQVILGDTKQAIGSLLNAIKVDQGRNNIEGVVETGAFLSYVYSMLGDTRKSEEFLAVALHNLKYVKSAGTRASASYYLGEVYYTRGDIPNIFRFHRQALALFRQTGDKEGEAKSLLALSYAHLGNDDILQGIALAQQSHEFYLRTRNKRGIALSSVALGLSQFRNGQVQDSIDSFNRAEQLFPLDVDRSERAVLVYNMGRVYDYLGDCESTLHYYKESLNILTEENNRSLAVGNLWSLGAAARRCDKPEEARVYLDRSLESALKQRKTDDVVSSYIELARLDADAGEFEKAEKMLLDSERILKNQSHKLSQAKIQFELGDVNQKANKQVAARHHYEKALSQFSLIRDKFAEASVLHRLAKLDALDGNNVRALETIQHSIAKTEELSSISSSKLSRTYFSESFERYDLYIELLMRLHEEYPDKGYAVRALQASERSRSRSLIRNLKMSGIENFSDANSVLVAKAKAITFELNRKADQLTRLLDAATKRENNEQSENLKNELVVLENKLEAVRGDLVRKSPVYSNIVNPPNFDLGEFQKHNLDSNTVALEFHFGLARSFVWLISKTGLQVFILPGKLELNKRFSKLQLLLVTSRTRKENEGLDDYANRLAPNEKSFAQESRNMSEILFGQYSKLLTDKRLLIIGDGALRRFPVSALPLPGTDSPFLISNEISYAPSASTVSLIRMNHEKSQRTKHNEVLVFSDPVYSASDPRSSNTGRTIKSSDDSDSSKAKGYPISPRTLNRLTASKAEGDAISANYSRSNVVNFTGHAASRRNFLALPHSEYEIIHLASHGLINEEKPELSGIVLSQYDETNRPQDSFLRFQDILGLKLNAKLVVLSACDTSVGENIEGEGLMSLTNAFLQAGAQSVISTSWKVDDNVTLELMQNFYESMSTNSSTPSEALRKAQIKMLRETPYKSPFYWAAFAVQGDNTVRPMIDRNFNLNYYLLSVVILAAVYGIFLLYIKKIRKTVLSV